MSEQPTRSSWLPTEAGSNYSSQSVTPEPFDLGFNYGAPPVWQQASFDGLSIQPSTYLYTSHQYTAVPDEQQQSFNQPLNVLLHDRNPKLHFGVQALQASSSSVPKSSILKRSYSSISSTSYQQEAAYIDSQSTSLQHSHGHSSQHNEHIPSSKKSCRLQTEIPGFRHNVLSRDLNPCITVKVDDTGRIRGQTYVFGAGEKVRRDLTPSENARTNRTRKLAACGRCKTLKQRCDRPKSIFMPCANCLRARISETVKPEHGLCIRVDIHDLSLHRNGTTGTTFLKEWLSRKEVLSHSSFPTSGIHHRTIQLSQGIDGLILEVPITEYVTESDDKTWYIWKDSKDKERSMLMPAFYICDMESTKKTLLQKLDSDPAGEYLISLLRNENDIIREAFREAHRLKRRSQLLSYALNIWCGTRFTELTWTICGDDKLGFAPPNETDNPWYGTVPVTPIMDTQLDEIAINAFLKPYDDQFLRELHRQMINPGTTDWYEVLLAMFIILHNFQRIFIDVNEYATRHGLEKSKSRGGASLSERNVSSCKSLLAYFHFAYLGSRRFFAVLTKSEGIETMSREQHKFLNLLRRYISEEDQLKDWQKRDIYDDSMFWINQLLVDDWKGDFKFTRPIDDLTEEDFLTT